MKAKELIEILKEYNPEAEIILDDYGRDIEYEFPSLFGSNGHTSKDAREIHIFIDHMKIKGKNK